MHDLSLHYLLAKITLLLLLVTTLTGIMLLLRRPAKHWYKLRIIHIITGFLTLLFFLLTYFLAPKI
jgi:hypothetical protein